jgi:hypothetical protein
MIIQIKLFIIFSKQKKNFIFKKNKKIKKLFNKRKLGFKIGFKM